MCKVLHFADTHFGVELYGRLDPETGLNTRLLDFRKSLQAVVDQAIEAGVELAVFAGDAYKTRDPRQTEQREFASCIRRLTDHDVPVVLLTGNHDMPSIKGRANAVEIYRTLGVTRVLVLSRPECALVETAAGPVRIAAMPYLIKGYSVNREEFLGKSLEETRQMLEAKYTRYIEELAAQARSAQDDIPTILLGHFWVSGARLSSWQEGYLQSAEPQVPLSCLLDPVFDYVALGHIHRHQDLNPGGQPSVVYSGSPDRIDFGEKEEPKGFVLVTLRKGQTDYRFMPLTVGRPLIEIDVDADCDSPTEKIVEEIRKHPLRNAVVKLTYRISHARRALVREREIHEALQPAFLIAGVNPRVQREAGARSHLLTELRTPREALKLYLETRDRLKERTEQLLASAEPLFKELEEEESA